MQNTECRIQDADYRMPSKWRIKEGRQGAFHPSEDDHNDNISTKLSHCGKSLNT